MRLAYQFQGQRSGSPGSLMLTHIVRHIFWTARLTNLKLGIRWRATTCISHRRHDLQDQRSRSPADHAISLSRVGLIADKSKTNSRSITNIGSRVPNDVLHCTSFKVKRITGRLTQTHKMCHIFRTIRLKNFKVGLRMVT